MTGNGSSSTPQGSKAPAAGAGGGGKPPRHPGRIKSVHELDGAVVVPATHSARGSKRQLVSIGNLQGPQSGGAGGGGKPPRHPGRKVVPPVAGGEEWEPFRCSLCKAFFISDEDLQCHIWRCHAHHRRHRMEEGPRLPPTILRHGHPSSSSRSNKKDCSVVSKQRDQEQQQQADEAAATEAPARPVVNISFDLNVPAQETAEEKTSSG